MVQVYFDARADPNDMENQERIGRPANIDAFRLRGKHFAVSRHSQRKVCTSCGYKSVNGKQSRKKTSNFCEKCNVFICKNCFERFHTKSKLN